MNLKILKDCSPHFLIIDHDGRDDIILYSKKILEKNNFKFIRNVGKFSNTRLHHHDAVYLFNASILKIISSVNHQMFASIYTSEPGLCYPVHCDGNSNLPINWSINYMLTVLDNHCKTQWFSSESVRNLKIKETVGNIIVSENKSLNPICSYVFQENDCVLMNTAIFHNFDNSASKNIRRILTLRCTQDNMSFESVMNKIMGLT
jgi:hypothetical protein